MYCLIFLFFYTERSWRDNWIFNRSNLSPYSSLGGGGLAGRTLDEVYLTVPQPDDDIAARVGNRYGNHPMKFYFCSALLINLNGEEFITVWVDGLLYLFIT